MVERRRRPAEGRRANIQPRADRADATTLRLVPDPRERAARAREVSTRRSLALLLAATAVLPVAGLVMVLSAGSISAIQGYGSGFWYFNRQLIYAGVGLAAMVGAARLPHRVWRRLGLPLLVASCALMLVALHPSAGSQLYGAWRWIDVGPFTIQPSEIAKLALVAVAATILARKAELRLLGEPREVLLPLGPVVAVVAILTTVQRDLGTTIILCGTVFLMLFLAGVRLRHLAIVGGSAILISAVLIFGEGYRRARFVDAWLDPQANAQGGGWQLIQSLIAIGSGGWTGLGLGASRAKWDFLPNAHSDFIFAVIAEELGLLGALVVLVAFATLIYAGIRIAMGAPDAFGRLLAGGIVAWIGSQTLINLGAVTGLLPITGVPLPLVSFGGTALVVTLTAIGVLISVARSSLRAATRTRVAGSSTRPVQRPARRGPARPAVRA